MRPQTYRIRRKHRREISLPLVTLDFYKSINHKSEKIISLIIKGLKTEDQSKLKQDKNNLKGLEFFKT